MGGCGSRERATLQTAGGHSANFILLSDKLILKAGKAPEIVNYEKIFDDMSTADDAGQFRALRPIVPNFTGTETRKDKKYMKLENLLGGYKTPSFMDFKMGTTSITST